MKNSRDHYVYRAIDADGVALYVGCTKRPRQRVQQHMNVDSSGRRRDDGAQWFAHHVDRWVFRGPFHRDDAYALERQQIMLHQPVFNAHTRGAGVRAERVERYISGQHVQRRLPVLDGDGIPAPVDLREAVESLAGYLQVTRDRAMFLLMQEMWLLEAEAAA